MHFCYIEKNGVRREVKNLGWLLRNWQTVHHLEFHIKGNHETHELVSIHRDGTEYHSSFEDLTVFWSWVDRPIFEGVNLAVVSKNKRVEWFIGNNGFRIVKHLPWKEQIEAITDKLVPLA